MKPTLLSLVIFACIMGAAILGLFLRTFLPEHHLREDSRSVVSSLGVGISGAMAAFVLALLVQGAQISFVDQRNELIELSANIEFLDKILNDYGPDANEARAVLRQAAVTTIDNFWYADRSQPDKLERDSRRTKELYNSILPLIAQSDTQHSLSRRHFP